MDMFTGQFSIFMPCVVSKAEVELEVGNDSELPDLGFGVRVQVRADGRIDLTLSVKSPVSDILHEKSHHHVGSNGITTVSASVTS